MNLAAGGRGLHANVALGSLELGLATLASRDCLDLLCLLLVLILLDRLGGVSGSVTGSLAHSRGLLTLGNNLLPAGTDDGALELGGLAATLLGDLLGGALLVEAAVEDGPVKLARVLLGQEVGLALAVEQAERLEAPSASHSGCSRIPWSLHGQRPCRVRDRSWHRKSCTAQSYNYISTQVY